MAEMKFMYHHESNSRPWHDDTDPASMYECLMSHKLTTPAQTLEWLPEESFDDESCATTQNLVVGTNIVQSSKSSQHSHQAYAASHAHAHAHKNGGYKNGSYHSPHRLERREISCNFSPSHLRGDRNHLVFASVPFPPSCDSDDDEIQHERRMKRYSQQHPNKFEVFRSIPHSGPVLKVRHLPQRSTVVCTRAALDSKTYLFDRAASFASSALGSEGGGRRSAHQCSPDLRLTGHSRSGTGLAWNEELEGHLLTCGDDGLICRHIVEKSPRLRYLDPVETYRHPSQRQSGAQSSVILTDVAWSLQSPRVFGSAASDGKVALWDIRQRTSTPTTFLQAHHTRVNSIAFNPSHDHLFVTGSNDERTPGLLWDTRNFRMAAHTFTNEAALDAPFRLTRVAKFQWSPIHANLLACSSENRVIVWDLTKIGAEVTPEETDPPEWVFTHRGHVSTVHDFCWNDDARIVSIDAEDRLQIWGMTGAALGICRKYRALEDDDLENCEPPNSSAEEKRRIRRQKKKQQQKQQSAPPRSRVRTRRAKLKLNGADE